MTVYGIKNCDTVKKAIKWLEAHDISFVFHDYKKQGIAKPILQEWSKQVGIENLINKKGSTWRKLDEATKEKATDETHAIDIMLSNTSIIKRPVIDVKGHPIIVGYDEESYKRLYQR